MISTGAAERHEYLTYANNFTLDLKSPQQLTVLEILSRQSDLIMEFKRALCPKWCLDTKKIGICNSGVGLLNATCNLSLRPASMGSSSWASAGVIGARPPPKEGGPLSKSCGDMKGRLWPGPPVLQPEWTPSLWDSSLNGWPVCVCGVYLNKCHYNASVWLYRSLTGDLGIFHDIWISSHVTTIILCCTTAVFS